MVRVIAGAIPRKRNDFSDRIQILSPRFVARLLCIILTRLNPEPGCPGWQPGHPRGQFPTRRAGWKGVGRRLTLQSGHGGLELEWMGRPCNWCASCSKRTPVRSSCSLAPGAVPPKTSCRNRWYVWLPSNHCPQSHWLGYTKRSAGALSRPAGQQPAVGGMRQLRPDRDHRAARPAANV